jgi:hypothetical protein
LCWEKGEDNSGKDGLEPKLAGWMQRELPLAVKINTRNTGVRWVGRRSP